MKTLRLPGIFFFIALLSSTANAQLLGGTRGLGGGGLGNLSGGGLGSLVSSSLSPARSTSSLVSSVSSQALSTSVASPISSLISSKAGILKPVLNTLSGSSSSLLGIDVTEPITTVARAPLASSGSILPRAPNLARSSFNTYPFTSNFTSPWHLYGPSPYAAFLPFTTPFRHDLRFPTGFKLEPMSSRRR